MKTKINSLSSNPPFPLSKVLLSRYRTWCEGFDACVRQEQTGKPEINPHSHNKTSETWRQGFAASRRVTQLAKELE